MPYQTSFDSRWNRAFIPKHHWHFHRRLYQHYGLVLGPGDFSRIQKDIRSGHALLVESRSPNRFVSVANVRSLHERIYALSDGKRLITERTPEARLGEIRRRLSP
ncbi:hypothetical protein FQ775_21795 [Nitratireductor mangrovi]|uniref:Uncharacterized protein n=1 Tax=Nitratireductor mangrovi TaxID=2599600 RepID=A0A5B8L457_9HYPH|nr:hypothetical protein [Nitratireductor mangrovi]QDZ02791.1 hypothetical protein FQ775_21795 [Nitratireductor mangrovi]